ncbi:MAG: hypothetical protein TREMPRED_002714 [Tremellales sp. Tagirdzhanova-0007]|nr:MAG: hypothetical protein TREMPRED_002714 [Tremellales sp. Tagirdzhanova-0007]
MSTSTSSTPPTKRSRSPSPTPDETTSLLARVSASPPRFPPIRRVFFVSFFISMTFAFTQTSLLYAFHDMTCDEYYRSHTWNGIGDRCSSGPIDAETAKDIALMASVTTGSSIVNLFVTGMCIKRFGVKTAMFQQTVWASMRNVTQIIALRIGAQTGKRIIQTTQLFNILGSGGGYLLAANAFVAAIVPAEQRTSQFGVLGGVGMLGNAAGYTFGGLVDSYFGHIVPVEVTFILLVSVTIFGSLFLPYIAPTSAISKDGGSAKNSGILTPLKLFMPRRGNQSLFLLGAGAFCSVLATGYVSIGLQLFAQNRYAFRPVQSGLMLSLTLLVKAFFLSICFPRIISSGRRWLSRSSTSSPTVRSTADRPDDPSQSDPTDAISSVTHDSAISPVDARHGSTFDLFFLQWSIFLDGVLTALVTLSSRGWHMFIAAIVIPFASGTGAAAKGLALDFVAPEDRADALSGIALIEKVAQISTIAIFGYVFAAFSEIGHAEYVFTVNGGIAMISFFILFFVRMPRVPGGEQGTA